MSLSPETLTTLNMILDEVLMLNAISMVITIGGLGHYWQRVESNHGGGFIMGVAHKVVLSEYPERTTRMPMIF